MNSYPEYKPINLKWLNQIPEHWNCERAKNMFIKMNRAIADSDETITCFRDGIVTLRKNRRTTGFTESLKEIGYQGIRKGDLVIHQMDAFAGSVGVSDSNGKGTPVYSVCIPKNDEYNNYYYAHLVREMGKNGFIQSLYRGIRERSSDFRFDTFSKLYLPIPHRSEQDHIVKYLDYKISKINKFIKSKKREIELLKELKQAEINSAVTKGLNPNVPMKDSGIDWLGEVPEHWEVIPLKQLVKSNIESLSNNTDPEFDLSYIDISSVGFGYLKQNPENYKFKDAPSRARRIVHEGDIIISTVRTYLKSFCLITKETAQNIVSTGFAVLTPFQDIDVKFLSYAFSADYFINSVIKNSIGISYPAISDLKLMSLKVILPTTKEEQKILVQRIEAKTKKIDKLIKAIEQEILFAQEYKTSLISDVVTGKVDVRNVKIEDTFDLETLEEVEDETEEVIE